MPQLILLDSGAIGRGAPAMEDRRTRHGRRAAALLLVTVSISFAAAAARAGNAPDISGLYQATAIVTGNDTRYRSSGFAHCLREVLVKLSGEPRLESDPRTAELAAEADALRRLLLLHRSEGRHTASGRPGELRPLPLPHREIRPDADQPRARTPRPAALARRAARAGARPQGARRQRQLLAECREPRRRRATGRLRQPWPATTA